jgi:hypothetical protein
VCELSNKPSKCRLSIQVAWLFACASVLTHQAHATEVVGVTPHAFVGASDAKLGTFLPGLRTEFEGVAPLQHGDAIILSPGSMTAIMAEASVVIPEMAVASVPEITVKGRKPPEPRIENEAAEIAKIKREAKRAQAAYLAMSAIDTAMTIRCVGVGKCKEANPLMGGGKPLQMIAAKAVLSAFHIWNFDRLLKKDPRAARRTAYISLGMQGVVTSIGVGMNF